MKNRFLLNAFLIFTMFSISFQSIARDKIVGGEKVTDLKEVPYMVSLSGVCGGSIVSSKWILTAAHCAGYFTNAKAGILNLRETGVSYKVKRVIKHPKYDRLTFSNDFALAELETEIDFSKTNLKAVKMATLQFDEDGEQEAGIDSTVFGFGDIADGEDNWSKDLNKVVVPIVSIEEANREEAYNGQIDETMLPAGYAGGGKDSCQGDSGGPLIVYNRNNEAVQVGVVSWGEGCAGPNKYGIYSKVSTAEEWIKKTISSN